MWCTAKKAKAESVDCVVDHVPKLGCAFRDELANYYAPYNEMLYKWIQGSSGEFIRVLHKRLNR